jgi:transposase
MARFKDYSYEQAVIIPIDFSKQIIPGTIEHTIHWLVENKIDTAGIERKYKNDLVGAPAYDPSILLKIILLAYSRGIFSSRMIMKACRENIVFRALSADSMPDFTTIASFVRSMKDEIRNIFTNVLLVCHEMDLLGGTELALDGCKMSSNASKEMSGTFSDLARKKDKIESTITFLIEKQLNADADEMEKKNSDTIRSKDKRVERLRKKSEKIERFLNEQSPKKKSRKGEAQSNITDNESAKMKTAHGVIQGYNGMALVDEKNQIVVHAEAYGSGHEHEIMVPMIEGAKEAAETIGLGNDYYKHRRIIADTGSFKEENLEYLHNEGIDAYIPDQQFRKRDPRFATADRHKPRAGRKGLYEKEDFTYDEERDIFICPAGKILKYSCEQVFGNTQGRRYISSRSNCTGCELREKCVRSEKTRYRTLYVIEKFFNRNYSDEMRSKIDTAEGREIYSRRMGIVEPVFGNIRCCKGLDRFTLRTREKVNIQWVLYTIVHNIEKIAKYGLLEGA